MLNELVRDFRLADFADIVLVSVVLYGLLIWMRRSGAYWLLIGGPVVAAVYLMARAFDMYLTLMVFHGLFAVVVIGLMIVFQDDLKRTLRRRAPWHWFGGRGTSAEIVSEVEAITQAVFCLASDRIGALVVLAGNEPLDQHVEGGVPLGGKPSVPLLCSLFDPHSAGHDGAALIEGQLVTRFGVHLPLSRNAERLGELGTRHSAALGLSERSDALVLVVSEERGTVSVAEEGRLDLLVAPGDLKDRIDEYYARRFPQANSSGRRAWGLFKDAPLKALAVVLASAAWGLLAFPPDVVERTFVVPIEYHNLPANTALDGTEPSEARVTLAGREAVFSMLDPGSLKVSLDLSQAKNGVGDFPINVQDVDRPFDLEVTHIEPRTARINLNTNAPALSANADRSRR